MPPQRQSTKWGEKTVKELAFLPDSLGTTSGVGFSQDQRWLAGSWYRCVEELIAIAVNTSGLTPVQARAVQSLWQSFLPVTSAVAGALDVDLDGGRLLGIVDIHAAARLHTNHFPCLPVIEAQALLATILRFGRNHRHGLAACARDGKARLDAAAQQLLAEVRQDQSMAKRYRGLNQIPAELAVAAFAGFLISEIVRGSAAWNRIRAELKQYGAAEFDSPLPGRELTSIQQWAFATAKRYGQTPCPPTSSRAGKPAALLQRLFSTGGASISADTHNQGVLRDYLNATIRRRAAAENKDVADVFFTSLCDWLWLGRPLLKDSGCSFEHSLSKAVFASVNRQFVQRVRTAFVAPVNGWAGPSQFPWLMQSIRAEFEVQNGSIDHAWLTPPQLRHIVVIRQADGRLRLAFLLHAADNHNLVSSADTNTYNQALNQFLFSLKQAPFIDIKAFTSVLASIFTGGNTNAAWDELEFRPSPKLLELSNDQLRYLRDNNLLRSALPADNSNRTATTTVSKTAETAFSNEAEIII